MAAATYVRMNSGWLKLPEEKPELSFCERAKKIYESKKIDPAKKEELIMGLYMRDFMSHPHNQDVPEAEILEFAEQYAVEMILSLNEGTI